MFWKLGKKQAWWLMLAAFMCYTGMYAVRKSFLAAQYSNLEYWGLNFKTILIISQVLGYMLSKFIGIKIIAELNPAHRSQFLMSLVGIGLIMLLLFGVVPFPWKPLTLFLNGLPLGMVFGIVLSFLEGRKNTEILTAALSATFIFSTGLIKSIGVWILHYFNVSDFFMPFTTALIFMPLFALSVWMLSVSEMPNEEDIVLRTRRLPMDKFQRINFLKTYGKGFSGLIIIYVILTILRDFRDNFIVEFWTELGYSSQPAIITLTEIPVAILVLLFTGSMMVIKNNKQAFQLGVLISGFSGLFILGFSILFELEKLSPILWVILTGLSIYLPYILFHCMIFERLMAFLKFTGTIGFLFYIADALGYFGSVGVLLIKEFYKISLNWSSFFTALNIYLGFALIFIPIFVLLSFKKY